MTTSHTIDSFAKLLEHVAASGAFAHCIQIEDELVYQLSVEDDGEPIMIEVDKNREVAVYLASLGSTDASSVNAFDNLAMGYNAVFNETGGFRIGNMGEDQGYVLIADFGLSAITEQNLVATVARFQSIAEGWRKAVAKGMTAQTGGSDPLSSSESMIRI